jgi:hypothetical protein
MTSFNVMDGILLEEKIDENYEPSEEGNCFLSFLLITFFFPQKSLNTLNF